MSAGDRTSLPERRFDEAEVAAIFERAAARDDGGRQPVPVGDGLTLAQLQEIGREIGIAPEAIAASAYVVVDGARPATRRVLGLPLGVERAVHLPRRLTDDEWERLVVDLRETFGARGVVRQEGSLRQWTNGNLHVLLEPTTTGQRVRLRTFKGNAPGLMGLGLTALGVGASGIAAMLMGSATDVGALAALATMTAAGAATLTATVAGLFPWARRRREQMTEVASRIAARAAAIDRPRDADAGSLVAGPPSGRTDGGAS